MLLNFPIHIEYKKPTEHKFSFSVRNSAQNESQTYRSQDSRDSAEPLFSHSYHTHAREMPYETSRHHRRSTEHTHEREIHHTHADSSRDNIRNNMSDRGRERERERDRDRDREIDRDNERYSHDTRYSHRLSSPQPLRRPTRSTSREATEWQRYSPRNSPDDYRRSHDIQRSLSPHTHPYEHDYARSREREREREREKSLYRDRQRNRDSSQPKGRGYFGNSDQKPESSPLDGYISERVKLSQNSLPYERCIQEFQEMLASLNLSLEELTFDKAVPRMNRTYAWKLLNTNLDRHRAFDQFIRMKILKETTETLNKKTYFRLKLAILLWQRSDAPDSKEAKDTTIELQNFLRVFQTYRKLIHGRNFYFISPEEKRELEPRLNLPDERRDPVVKLLPPVTPYNTSTPFSTIEMECRDHPRWKRAAACTQDNNTIQGCWEFWWQRKKRQEESFLREQIERKKENLLRVLQNDSRITASTTFSAITMMHSRDPEWCTLDFVSRTSVVQQYQRSLTASKQKAQEEQKVTTYNEEMESMHLFSQAIRASVIRGELLLSDTLLRVKRMDWNTLAPQRGTVSAIQLPPPQDMCDKDVQTDLTGADWRPFVQEAERRIRHSRLKE